MIVDIYTTENKYNIIYCDPPWRYWEGGLKNQSRHYPTMPIEDIIKFPVPRIAAENSILFLWTTSVILPESFDIIKRWGFNYSTVAFVWVKSKKDGTGFAFGNGSWTRANAEYCLVAKKGKLPRMSRNISQIVYEPRREHSRKPDSVRSKIVALVGDLPRIELFAREENAGWDSYGNEINHFT